MVKPAPLPAPVRDYLRKAPKAELHVHLEGSMRPERMLEFSRRYFGDAPWQTADEVAAWFEYRHFQHFLDVFARVCMCLQRPEDFRVLAQDYFSHAAAQGVVYAELITSPSIHRGRGQDIGAIIDAIGEARAEARERYGIESGVILDISRQFGGEIAWDTVREAVALRERGVVGIGLGGNERDFPPHLFREQFAAAKSEGLGLCCHAGEWAGPESMRGAMETLGATRLGHGTAVRMDATLLKDVRDRGVMLDMCPISNVRTKSIGTLSEHPFQACLDAGISLSLNSDDPTLFQTTILGEYETLHANLGVPADRLARVGREAMGHSFADRATRERVTARMDAILTELV